ncbi:hypothetical protein [Streptomyces sp. NPDC057257]|uniref:hypothetical protein n=1 Tax=Streptomyces sp. NPDC057257 TaxID=3346071 RepID=UPI00363AACB4
MTTTTQRTELRDPRSFLSPKVWDRKIKLLVRDNPFETVTAVHIFGQAVAYLITAMEKGGLGLGCGYLVAMGVHAFILDIRNYADFCSRNFYGWFLHHTPEIQRKHDGTVMRTARVIESNGFAIDWPLWEQDALQCSSCSPDSNCH